ncbi:hypothetical protein ACPOL_0100 [Acidisarcina polymorpha]|uniref:Uncharacterized protein n=1 Tax=Acidisarcina polymorpha TaxID=2211140 RepID=A0A2Z5FSP3_9BACT|nr:hypothetical protein ACPOL_0100 [Acidisarcina polymorpha]
MVGRFESYFVLPYAKLAMLLRACPSRDPKTNLFNISYW